MYTVDEVRKKLEEIEREESTELEKSLKMYELKFELKGKLIGEVGSLLKIQKTERAETTIIQIGLILNNQLNLLAKLYKLENYHYYFLKHKGKNAMIEKIRQGELKDLKSMKKDERKLFANIHNQNRHHDEMMKKIEEITELSVNKPTITQYRTRKDLIRKLRGLVHTKLIGSSFEEMINIEKSLTKELIDEEAYLKNSTKKTFTT